MSPLSYLRCLINSLEEVFLLAQFTSVESSRLQCFAGSQYPQRVCYWLAFLRRKAAESNVSDIQSGPYG